MRPPFYQRYPQLTTPPATGRFAASEQEGEVSGYVALWLAVLEEPETSRHAATGTAPLTSQQWVTQQRVQLDGDEVVKGQVAVAAVMVDATLAHNPNLVGEAWTRWDNEGRASDDDESTWRRRYEQELDRNPGIFWALVNEGHGREQLFKRAGLDEGHRLVARLFYADNLSTREIGRRLSIDQRSVRRWLEDVRERLRGLTISPAI